MQARSLLVATIVVLAAAVPAGAQSRQDARLAEDIVRTITTYPRFSIFDDVSVSVENGLVTLTGKVTMPYKRDELARRAARVDGVREVQNRIDVLPVSTFDEDLRYRIPRAIYGNPSFWRYAARANPPIHIIVERGRVTLTGVVNSNVERMLARSLATGWGELSVSNELKTDDEVRIN